MTRAAKIYGYGHLARVVALCCSTCCSCCCPDCCCSDCCCCCLRRSEATQKKNAAVYFILLQFVARLTFFFMAKTLVLHCVCQCVCVCVPVCVCVVLYGVKYKTNNAKSENSATTTRITDKSTNILLMRRVSALSRQEPR